MTTMTKPRDPPPRPAPRRAPTAAPAAPDDSRFIVHPLPSAYPKHGPPTPEELAEYEAWERAGGMGAPPRLLWPKIENIITEDDAPVDNLFSEKQQRLLTESRERHRLGTRGASWVCTGQTMLRPAVMVVMGNWLIS